MPSLAASLLLTSLASSSSASSSPSSARVLLASPLSSASSQSSTSSLTVTFSDGSKQPYSHTDALFGIPAYQSGTAGLLYYPLKDAGDTSAPGCAPLTDPGISRRLVLLDRSSPSDNTTCTFTQKVSNAQQAGALGVVVIDSLGLCGDPKDTQCWGSPDCSLCPLAQAPGGCQCALPMMADSGGGSSISIPSMLVSRSDGVRLRQAASDAATLPVASMRWDIPAADGSVTVTMWQDSIDQAASAFRNSWALYVPYLQTSTHFVPHFYVSCCRGRGPRKVCDTCKQLLSHLYPPTSPPPPPIPRSLTAPSLAATSTLPSAPRSASMAASTARGTLTGTQTVA